MRHWRYAARNSSIFSSDFSSSGSARPVLERTKADAGGSTDWPPSAWRTVRRPCSRESSFWTAFARSPTSSSHEHVRIEMNAQRSSADADARMPAFAKAYGRPRTPAPRTKLTAVV